MFDNAPSARLSRRQALGSLAVAPFSLVRPAAPKQMVLLWLGGGLSQLDSFDPKPGAPAGIRGPLGSMPTSVEGIRISSALPSIAARMHKMTLVRSMTSGEAHHQRAMERMDAGPLPVCCQTPVRSAEAALQALGRGERAVHIESPWLIWDTHEAAFDKLANRLLPHLDRELATLIDGLESAGLFDSTLVIATGEFGRSPRINREGGRDHHAAAWSALMAGAGLGGGRLVGRTDAHGERVIDTPVTPEDLSATAAAICGHTAPRRGSVIGQLWRS